MQYPKIPLAQTVIQLCKAKNIKHIVISPGSRNAPLTIGFTYDDFFACYSIVDERCAGFFALGIAQKTKQPVAVVCTSGSAMLNYYPAVTEAYYSNIPLIVLSADRPKHLIGIGDGQTINQENVYRNHILCSTNLKLDLDYSTTDIDDNEPEIIKNLENKLERFLGIKLKTQEGNEFEINKTLNIAIAKSGPVHINIPFSEPLYELTDTLSVNPKNIEIEEQNFKIDDSILQECITDWNSASKKMILVGVNQPNEIDQEWLDKLADDNSIVVFTETTSNIHNSEFFTSIDKLIAPLSDADFKQLQPDILITFGGLIVSKKIKSFLREFKPKQHWHIDDLKANDTFFSLNRYLKITPNSFFEMFLPKTRNSEEGNYKSYWTSKNNKRNIKHQDYLKQVPFSDFKVFDCVLKALKSNTVLQLGNSSTIRYVQLFNLNKSIQVFCNRGTSGIDGSTSTAIGSAVASKIQTTFITGDLSFFYDSNALWNNYIPNNFRIIVINNQGGGIFRILPGDKNTDKFDQFFETTHNLNASSLCEMYGFDYNKALNDEELDEQLETFFVESEKPKLLEIFTPRKINDEVLLAYFKYIA